jgi:hypothetical protein
MFGSAPPPQSETTPFQPRSPNAVAKVYSYWMTRIYREGHRLFASNGILFNDESRRRGETFVTRKITRGIAAILAHKQDSLFLGNLEARRDWGYANTLKPFRRCYSRKRLATLSSAQEKPTPSGNFCCGSFCLRTARLGEIHQNLAAVFSPSGSGYSDR